MARYKVLVSFVGLVTGAKEQTINIDNEAIAKDLLQAKYIQAVETGLEAPAPAKTTRKRKTKNTVEE